jgi:hypothetical protein
VLKIADAEYDPRAVLTMSSLDRYHALCEERLIYVQQQIDGGRQ